MAKIVATVSPDTENLEGIDVGRINGSFGTKEDIAKLIKRIKDEMKAKVILDLPRCRKKHRTNSYTDDELIEIAKENNVDFLGLSYIQTGKDVEEIREKIEGTDIKLVSKIEAKEAEENLEDIIKASDGAMIDRGDLANAIGLEKLPRLQKRIIRKCNEYGKLVIVATEMLMSMINDKEPTKAEVLDIANAVADGADYVMLSEETAIGKHPNHVVSTMKRVLDEVSERYKVIILAAGSCSGLGALTATHHVCLADIGDGKTILDLQLESLKANGVYEEDIIIAAGKGSDQIREYLKDTDVTVVYNPWYNTTNMMATIWLARHMIQKGFIVIYGDIVFEDEILKKVLENKADIVLAVDKHDRLDEEDEKICIEDGKMALYEKYKELPSPRHKCIPLKSADGEFIGIAKFNRQGAALLAREMDEIMEKGEVNTYLMTAFENMVSKGHDLSTQYIDDLLWDDNDTIHDIEKTKQILPDIIKRKF